MIKNTKNLYDPALPYKDRDIDTGNSVNDFPIIEHVSNAIIFPEGIHDEIDLKQFDPEKD